jgi:histidine ammonia-lyase
MGFSGIDIETVKRLLEMYNNNIFPIAYTAGFDDTSVFSQLFLSLIGLGDVYYKGEKIAAAKALKNMNWQPLKLKSKEALALITGNQYTNAYCLYQFKKMAESKKLTEAQDDATDILLKAVNTLSDSIVINAAKDAISYQTPDNTALIATLELLNNG